MENSRKEMSAEQLKSLLSERQLAFAEALAGGAEPTEAARKAGYSEKIAAAQGARMLKNETVRAYRDALEQERAPQPEVTPQWVWRKLAEVAERCMEQTPHMVWDKESRSYVHDGTFEFDADGAIKALSAIGKMAMGSDGQKERSVGRSIEDFLEELEGGRHF